MERYRGTVKCIGEGTGKVRRKGNLTGCEKVGESMDLWI